MLCWMLKCECFRWFSSQEFHIEAFVVPMTIGNTLRTRHLAMCLWIDSDCEESIRMKFHNEWTPALGYNQL